MIFQGSRYEQVAKTVYAITTADGQQHLALQIRFLAPTPAAYRHTMSANERLDLLAYHFYGDPQRFWLIADANAPVDPEDLLEPGLEILIPPDRRL